MEISVSNNNFIVVSSSGTLTIPIDAIEKFTTKTAYETVVVFYRQGKTNRYVELKVSEITNPVFADFNALVTWCNTNLVVVFDYNDLINVPTNLSKVYDGIPLNATHASATLEFDGSGTSVQAGDTVTIGTKVYTYVAALSVLPTEGEVLIGADDTTAMANLMMAINDIGISYGLTHWCTVNAEVKFDEYHGANGMTIETKVGGVGGNIIAVNTDIANAEWQNSGGVLTTTLVGGMNGTLGHVGDRYFPPADPTHFWVAVADNDLTDENWVLTDVKYENCVYVTHSDLQLLVASNGLQVGKKYAIYDYVAAWNIFDGGTMAIEEEQTGIGEILIATAISTNEIDSSVVSVTYPQDIIHYSLDLVDDRDIGFGDGAGTPIAVFKGMIYYRKDTIQNVETHYDFRNIKFRRWAVDAVAFDNGAAYVAKDICKASDGKIYKCITATTGEGDPSVNTSDWVLWLNITADAFVSWTSDKTKFKIGDITTDNLIINNVTAGVDYDDFYTFGDYYNWVKNVSIGMIDLEYAIGDWSYATQLNNIVFKTIDNYYTCFGNNIGSNCWNNAIGNGFYYNTIGNNFNSNTIGNNFKYNTIGNEFNSNTIGNGFMSNTIGNEFKSNTIGDNFNYSTIGNNFGNNTIGDNFNYNTIGNNFSYNTIGNEFYYNTIGNNFNYNTIGDNFNYNTIGNEFYKTIFGDNCQYNTIANKINGTTDSKIITFGDSITMCTIQDYAFGVLAADLDLTAATHIRGAYNTTIYQDKTDGVKLSYMDGGVPQYVDVTA